MSETPIPGTDFVAVDPLPPPPPLIVLTVATTQDGNSDVRYIMPPAKAAQALREIADGIEAQITERAAQAEGQGT